MIETHTKSLTDILEAANLADTQDAVVSKIKQYIDQPYVRFYLDLAINDKWTTLDVDTVVPTQYGYHQSMAGASLLNKQTVNIITNVIMGSALQNKTKAHQYKALMEMLTAKDADLFKAILVKNIQSIYPKVTVEVIQSVLS